MQLSQSQIQKLSLELKLTPQQILQSTILQLTTMALETRIDKELEENPLLDLDEDNKKDDQKDQDDGDGEKEEDNLDWEDILPQNDDYKPKIEYDRSSEERKFVQPSPQGMTEYLFDQLRILNFDESDEKIALQIIWNLDDKGYLRLPIDNIAFTLDIPIPKAENVLYQIQRLNPPGIAARDLRECLLIQLEEKEDVDDAVLILTDFFDDFANRRFNKLRKKLGWEDERLLDVQREVQKLNPKPGLSLTSQESGYIFPDLIVNKINDEFIIEINDSRVPDLRINSSYLNMISKTSKVSRETKTYLKKKVDMANWFIQAIHQRRVTMIRVMNAIINRQKDFFHDITRPLKPMILKDIAEDVKMDISTISRVTNGKYVQLDSGVYELKYFFNEGMKNSSGEDISTRIIKEKLNKIVASENKQKPFSDEKLSELLKKAGFPVARRTVAKYRMQLDIPVARLRRKV